LAPQRVPILARIFGLKSPAGRESETDRYSDYNHNLIELAIRLALISILVYWTSVIVYPFAPIIAWSVIMTVALYPAYKRLSTLLGERHVPAAILITLFGLVVMVGPVTWLGLDMLEVSRTLMPELVQGRLLVPPPPEAIKHWPLVGQQIFDYWSLASTNLRSALAPLFPQLRPIGEKLLETLSDASVGTLKFLASVVVMGFMFVHGQRFVTAAKSLASKIDRAHGVAFLELAVATIHAVSRGVIGLSLLEAVLAGAAMSLMGVPAASILTLVVLLLGIVQIGPAIIVIGTVIWAWSAAPGLGALAFTLCMATVSFLDNFAKPFVLAHGLATPTLVTFIGVIGGMLAHGIIGLFVGPVVVAVAWNLADAWLHDGVRA
jgi:predicted PurR-regulated permease PerM